MQAQGTSCFLEKGKERTVSGQFNRKKIRIMQWNSLVEYDKITL